MQLIPAFVMAAPAHVTDVVYYLLVEQHTLTTGILAAALMGWHFRPTR